MAVNQLSTSGCLWRSISKHQWVFMAVNQLKCTSAWQGEMVGNNEVEPIVLLSGKMEGKGSPQTLVQMKGKNTRGLGHS